MNVTIIIPIYNVAPYIKRCLLSVIKQTYTALEIILVDDCGTDNSMEIVFDIVNEYQGDRKILILKHECNKGLSAARNTGIKNATGDYVLFLDSDDEIPLDAVSLMIDAIDDDLDFVIGNIKLFGSDTFQFNFSLPTGTVSGNSLILNTFIEGKWYSMAVNKLIRRDFLLKNGLWFKEKILHEDELWSFMLAMKANKMRVINNYTYNYYIRNDSITGKITIKNYESNMRILLEKKILIESLNDIKVELFLYKQILDFYFSLLIFRPPYEILRDFNFELRKSLEIKLIHLKRLSLSYILKYILICFPVRFLKFLFH